MQKNTFHNKHILIVDDTETNILVLKNMLEDDGYEHIFTCTRAKEAYELLDKEDIDLILLDVMMPEIDGIEACKTIRQSQEHNDISIVMVTADDSDETLTKSFDAGANDFTTKPINFINLNTRIQSVLSLKEKDTIILNQTRATAMNDIIDTISQQWTEPLHNINEMVHNLDALCKNEQPNITLIKEGLQDIGASSTNLTKTIDIFRSISKVEHKQVQTDINKLLIYTLKIIQDSYKSHNIILQFKEEQKINKIMVYPNELVRVLLNIFINSQEAFSTQEHNAKRIVQIVISQSQDYTSISIKDNAGGIKEENMKHIFDPYFTTKKDNTGNGLGLYSCKQVIEQHLNGNVDIISKKNTTELLVTLPSKFDIV